MCALLLQQLDNIICQLILIKITVFYFVERKKGCKNLFHAKGIQGGGNTVTLRVRHKKDTLIDPRKREKKIRQQ